MGSICFRSFVSFISLMLSYLSSVFVSARHDSLLSHPEKGLLATQRFSCDRNGIN